MMYSASESAPSTVGGFIAPVNWSQNLGISRSRWKAVNGTENKQTLYGNDFVAKCGVLRQTTVRACVRVCVCVCARVRACVCVCVCVCVVCVVCCYALPILSQQQCAPCTQKPVGVTGVMKPPTSQIGKSKIANEIDKYTRLTQLAVRFLLQCSFKLVEQCSTCLKASQQMKPLSFFKTPSSGI